MLSIGNVRGVASVFKGEVHVHVLISGGMEGTMQPRFMGKKLFWFLNYTMAEYLIFLYNPELQARY